LNWDFVQLADDIGEVLFAEEAGLRAEQAVHGMDVRDERELQKLLAEKLAAKYEVAREVHYPSTVDRKLSHRPRCDLVLTPLGHPLRLDHNPPTLFDHPSPARSEDALWLEIKIAYQYRAWGVPHAGYGGQWRNAVVEDLKKMETEPGIREAGLVLIVFNQDRTVLEKDLELFEDILMVKEVLAGFRKVRSVDILDRIGHRVCSVAVWPTIQR
jgi:hypothetical protein